MTAKEILFKNIPDDCYWEEMGNLTNTPIKHVEKAMNQYALQIAEQAIEKEKATYREGWYPPNLDRILSRIKKLTQ